MAAHDMIVSAADVPRHAGVGRRQAIQAGHRPHEGQQPLIHNWPKGSGAVEKRALRCSGRTKKSSGSLQAPRNQSRIADSSPPVRGRL